MDSKEKIDITDSPAWHIISQFATDEIKAKQSQIMATLKSGEITDINKTFAELRNKAGSIQAMEIILDIPRKLKERNKGEEK